jgi:hypothetical protein
MSGCTARGCTRPLVYADDSERFFAKVQITEPVTLVENSRRRDVRLGRKVRSIERQAA